ncbi:MAG: hypothetical protein MR809_01985 [Rikenellaceae bacterium]|nr:hypothetical protein [Rikenellaceae bacterium]
MSEKNLCIFGEVVEPNGKTHINRQMTPLTYKSEDEVWRVMRTVFITLCNAYVRDRGENITSGKVEKDHIWCKSEDGWLIKTSFREI